MEPWPLRNGVIAGLILEQENVDDSHVCLDIPLPTCIQDLRQPPPRVAFKPRDHEVLYRLEDFGRQERRSAHEITQAKELAWGYSDVVVLLESPARNHRYDVDFDTFVKSSPTLKAVDNLIRFATRGYRSIGNVTVLDALSFKEGGHGNRRGPSVSACHRLLADMLKIKRPDIIISCYRESLRDARIERLSSPNEQNPVVRVENSFVVWSLHPARAVVWKPDSASARVSLVSSFVFAFAKLCDGRREAPSWMITINDLVRQEGSRSQMALTGER